MRAAWSIGLFFGAMKRAMQLRSLNTDAYTYLLVKRLVTQCNGGGCLLSPIFD